MALTKIKDGSLAGSINATKLADGTVTSAELQYINTLSSNAQTQIATKSPIASPTFTGTPAVPTASAATNTTQIASTAFVRTEVANLVDSAPGSLDTLNELAAALGDDASFSTTVTNSIALKAPIASPTFTGNFTSVGIDDNADQTVLTLGSDESATFAGGVIMGANKYLYLDGGGDTYIAETSANNVKFNIGGTHTMHMQAGKVGIGCTPDVNLHVNSDSGSGYIYLTSGGNNAAIMHMTANKNSSANWCTISAGTNGDLMLGASGSGTNTDLVVKNDNSVSIANALAVGGAIGSSSITSTGSVKAEYHTLMDGNTTCGQFIREETITGSGTSQDVCLFAEGGLDIHFMTGGATNKVLTLDTSNNATFLGSVTIGSSNSDWFTGGNLNIDSGQLYVNSDTHKVGIGTTNPDCTFEVANGQTQLHANGAATNPLVVYNSQHTTADQVMVNFYRGNYGFTGAIRTTNDSTSYTSGSDYRLKENEVAISDGITRLKQLKPYRFNFKANVDRTVDGFFAHEVSDIVPEAVSGEKDAVDENGDIDMQVMDNAKIVPLLVSALQEAIDRIEVLENA